MTLELLMLQNAAQAATKSKSLLDHIQSGGPIGYLIILLSFVAIALAVYHFIQIRFSRLAPPEVVTGLDKLLAQGDTVAALKFCKLDENDCSLTRIFGAALTRCSRSAFGFLEMRTALEESGKDEVARLYRSVDGIGLIAAVAPMMGLFGTVVGMVGAFDTISVTEGFAKPAQLAGDISVALITTVLGLVVAIPCTALHWTFKNQIEKASGSLAQQCEDLASHLEQTGGSPRPPAPPPRRTAPPAPAPTQAGPR